MGKLAILGPMVFAAAMAFFGIHYPVYAADAGPMPGGPGEVWRFFHVAGAFGEESFR
jgi:hypothetical protein